MRYNSLTVGGNVSQFLNGSLLPSRALGTKVSKWNLVSNDRRLKHAGSGASSVGLTESTGALGVAFLFLSTSNLATFGSNGYKASSHFIGRNRLSILKLTSFLLSVLK